MKPPLGSCVWGCSGSCGCAECWPDELRRFDPETQEWVYFVECIVKDHRERVCPCDHEMFRVSQNETVG
jgi:hypothetical protein